MLLKCNKINILNENSVLKNISISALKIRSDFNSVIEELIYRILNPAIYSECNAE